ncbi:MAG: hypothetical protein CMF80_07335 [Candidatus Marinimicrobia bacterium]|nr:hypothetical protein [Candidatus Neomarinimicrobiota bacterium]|tara:strand:+ start:143 stop:1285 length:1143 start_codon:yes stop_codon:yes gene_type:complete
MSKLLAQGGFGCIYYPGIDCDGKVIKSKNYVSKLQKKNSTSNNEVEIGDRIKKIPNNFKYFRTHEDECDINLSSVDKKLLKNCHPIKLDEDIPYMVLKFRYLDNPDFFSVLFDSNTSKNHRISYIIQSYLNIIKGFNLLSDINVVQFDLKNENILFDRSNNNFIITDFGISLDMGNFKMEKLLDYFYVYAPDYYIWSFDVHVLCYLARKEDKFTKDILVDMINKFIDANPGMEIFSQDFKNIYFNKCFIFGSKYLDISGKNRDDNIKKLISNFKTWDNYSVSALYLRILHILYDGTIPESNFLVEYGKLLVTNLCPDPEDRLSFKDTYDRFTIIVKESLANDKSITTGLQTDETKLKTSIEKSKIQTIELIDIRKSHGIL